LKEVHSTQSVTSSLLSLALMWSHFYQHMGMRSIWTNRQSTGPSDIWRPSI
jgi:hypothetical protein